MLLLATLVRLARLGQLELLDRPEQTEQTEQMVPLVQPDLLALREPTESMERPDPPVLLALLEPMELTGRMVRLVQQVRRARPEQPVSYRASPPLVFSSPTRTARPRLPQARS